MDSTKTLIGIMDPNGYAFRASIEKLIAHLKPEIVYENVKHEIKTRRITTRPYDVLHADCPYHAIINRGAHWNPHHNSFFMTVGHETYLLNDMVSFHAINKNTSYGHMFKLGFHIPPTVAIPQQDNEEIRTDPRAIPELIFSEHEWFDLEEIGNVVGYPAYLKPQSGGGWVGVEKVESPLELVKAYNHSGSKPMNLQKAIDYREFVRTVGIGPQIMPMHYNAKAKYSHNRYMRNDLQAVEFDFLSSEERREVTQICKIMNAFYNWDHNSCEILIGHDGVAYPIDFANAYPDSSLVSLHFYFPDLVKNMARWMLFCAVTRKKKSHFAQDWHKYFELMSTEKSYYEKLDDYEKLADQYFETEKFEKFCRDCLSDFDEKAFEFFSGEEFDQIIEKEVGYYFKIEKEIPKKITHYKGIHHFWLQCEKDKLLQK